MNSKKDVVTWADYHRDVGELFARDFIPWPCEKINTGLKPVVQPCLAKGPGQELFVSGYKGHVFHSTDLGKTWSVLCIAPPLNPEVPDGFELAYLNVKGGVTIGGTEVGGIGATREGTLLLVWNMSYKKKQGGQSDDETDHRITWVTRSEDRGITWRASSTIDPAPYGMICSNQGNVIQLSDGRVAAPFLAHSTIGSDTLRNNTWGQAIYISSDDGRSWSHLSYLAGHGAEPHLLELGPGRMLASVRYQQEKGARDPANLATDFSLDLWLDFAHQARSWEKPTDVGVRIFQNTVLTASADGGRTWSTPKLVTGLLQQSGSLVRLSDGALVLTFGRPGQRFMLSYDDGQTWSKAVYQLHDDGEYARAVALEDDTIVVIHDFGHYMYYQEDDTCLGALRFKVPPREEVDKHGFFTPRELEQGLA